MVPLAQNTPSTAVQHSGFSGYWYQWQLILPMVNFSMVQLVEHLTEPLPKENYAPPFEFHSL